jgi:tetratricopeptide (TPR) repeat protein/transglutaminase-like putative cysteine protease
VLTATLLSFALAAAATAPWDGAPFQGGPDDVRAAVAALQPPEDAAVDLLLQEYSYAFDAQGRLTFTFHLVFRPLTREAANDWASFSMSWAPWHQERPEIRARIIGPNGEVHTLDPSTFTEAGADDPDSAVYTNRRLLRGPLPAVEAGAIVEEVATVRESAVEFDAGTVYRFCLGRDDLPMRRVRLHIETAAGVHIIWHSAGGIADTPIESVLADRHLLAWDWKDVEKQKTEPNLPPDVHATRQITFTTGTSWRAAARSYSSIVEHQLAGEDLAATARAVVAPGDSEEVAAQKLLDWMSTRVRYTGLELKEAALVPARPRDTLQRHFGDCKDLAMLLSGLLRAAGYPATLALLRTEPDDVDPELPGIGLFDHAIVYVPGNRPLFVDATSPSTRVGTLPPDDQGRLALVLGWETKGLTPTPLSTASDNAIAIQREIVLSEGGLAHVTQTSDFRGAPGSRMRVWRQHLAENGVAMRKDDEEFTLKTLNAKKFLGVTVLGLVGSSTVTVRREADESKWAVVNSDDAEAIVSLEPAFRYLPSALVPDEEPEATPSLPAPERRGMLWVSEPTALDVQYHIVPPPGFHPASLPTAEQRTFGPLVYDCTYTAAPDQTVTVNYRVVLDVRRIAPADIKVIREWIAKVKTAEEPRIRFLRTSSELLNTGKGREGIDELHRLIALYPEQACYHNLLAIALLRLGMVEAGRREARRAVELEPANEWPHRVLSSALTYDLLGRPLHKGCDLAGAVSAQRRAVELKPEPSSRARLAFLLAHDANCERFAAGARLDEAIAIYRSIHEDLKSTDYDEDYVETLMAAGNFADARALAKPLKASSSRTAALLVAAAAGGPDVIVREAQQISPSERVAGLWKASQHLARKRMYPELSTLLRSASGGVVGSAELLESADTFARVRRRDGGSLDPTDPGTLPRRLFRAIMSDDPEGALRSIALARTDDVVRAYARDYHRFASKYAERWGVPDSDFLDLVDSLLTVKTQGNPLTGERLLVELPGGFSLDLVAVPRGGSLRVALGRMRVSALAAATRQRLDAGDTTGAASLLGLTPLKELDAEEEDDLGTVARALWTHGSNADVDELRAVATVLEAAGSAEAIPALVQLREATPPGQLRRVLAWGLASAYRNAERWDEAIALATEIAAADPSSAGAFRLQTQALRRLGRRNEVHSLAEARLHASPSDSDALRALGYAAMDAGDGTEAWRYFHQLVDLGKAKSTDYNNLAWSGLWVSPPPPDQVAIAQKTVALTKEGNRTHLHTLSTVYAANGRPAEALQVLIKGIDLDGNDVQPEDWLVFGRVAEQYGLLEDALAAYGRVPTSPRSLMNSGSLAKTWSDSISARTGATGGR